MNLFTPHSGLGLRNRSVMAPLTRYNCSEDGIPGAKVADYYIRRAQNGVGLIIVESAAVSQNAKGYKNGASFYSEEHADAWAPIVEKVHASGSKIWIQLFHAGRLTVPEISGSHPLAPSPIKPGDYPSFWRPKTEEGIVNFQTSTPYVIPLEISDSEIEDALSNFETAVELAEKVGFDGVEIHGAHGYLIHTFLSHITNKRIDKYGLMNGYQFVEDLIKRCRAKLKKSTVLSFRCSIHMIDNPMIRFSSIDNPFIDMIPKLDSAGVDVFHSSEIDARKPLFGAKESLHEVIRANTVKPIIICGAIQSLADANKLLEKDNNALIAFGRNFISNPNLIKLFEAGQEDQIVKFEYARHINTIY